MKTTIIFPNVLSEQIDLTVKSNDSKCLFFSIEGKEVAVLKEDITKALNMLNETEVNINVNVNIDGVNKDNYKEFIKQACADAYCMGSRISN